MSEKPFETIIFDMDGVIIDSTPVHTQLEQELFQELGLNITPEIHQKYVGTSSRDMWADIIEMHELDVSVQDMLDKNQNRYWNYLQSANRLASVDGVDELIRYLHKSRRQLILASSELGENIELILDTLKLSGYFSFYVSGAELERSKPDPGIFLEAARRGRCPVEECCVIEDSRNGVLAAKAANMKCIGYRNPTSGNQDLSKADVIVDDFTHHEIEAVLTRIFHSE